MNQYTYKDLSINMKESFEVEVTQEMMSMFQQLSGDINPLHVDKSFAAKRGYPDRVVYGMLVSSFYSTLAGVYLPGENSLIHSIEIKMKNPVFPGDKLTIQGKVSEMHDAFQLIRVSASITNQNNKIVSKATIQIGVLSDEQ